MLRRLVVGQDKGMSGKSTLVRAVAELDLEALIAEIEANKRLIELGNRVRHCAVRATREEIERTGGRAARAEFDSVLAHLFDLETPRAIIDTGANCGNALFDELAERAPQLAEEGVEIGVIVPVTADPGAIASAAVLLAKAPLFARKTWLVLNNVRGPVELDHLPSLRELETPPVCSRFDLQTLEDEALRLLNDGGLAPIKALEDLTVRRKFTRSYGPGPGYRICRDLMQFRVSAMESVKDAVHWLGGN